MLENKQLASVDRSLTKGKKDYTLSYIRKTFIIYKEDVYYIKKKLLRLQAEQLLIG